MSANDRNILQVLWVGLILFSSICQASYSSI